MGCCFGETSKTCPENTFLHAKIIYVSWSLRWKLLSWHYFYHFINTTAPQQVIFSGKLSTVIILKRCKYNVKLLTLWFMFYTTYPDPLKISGKQYFTWVRLYPSCISSSEILLIVFSLKLSPFWFSYMFFLF